MIYLTAVLFAVAMFALIVIWSIIEFYLDLRKPEQVES